MITAWPWFVEVACHLGEGLVVENTGRCVEAGDGLELGTDLQRDLRGDVYAFQVPGDIEIGFVER